MEKSKLLFAGGALFSEIWKLNLYNKTLLFLVNMLWLPSVYSQK